ncbi:hypothetical protein [Myceligenerans pegani]|uniref:Uncharacterized protein n=1 Tax=Myceligenerans pegani TaxID=2776917 RepID=A0ABR9N580_9MICO|nr:hypothetical protein [Myceligenerans sp. TRM 65318]MBE1878426.1 hypothetical protein [Myceligenerans sp. TRM 65318]MBE3020697.1 hypothetical protein [Myceligenerans sp. TRM 65318]
MSPRAPTTARTARTAALLRELVGPSGSVVAVDIDDPSTRDAPALPAVVLAVVADANPPTALCR